jgi:Zn-dependent protease
LIGLILGQGSLLQMFIWIGIIFVSVLFHEFGHALTATVFGQKPRIELVAMGGLTYHDGEKLPFWKQFFITLNGPVFGFLIVIGATLLMKFGYVSALLQNIRVVNLIWTIVNLFPVLPLDGGQLMRIVLEKVFHAKGIRYAMVVSTVIAFAFSLALFLTQNFLGGAIFFLFAFENFDSYRKTRGLRESDRDLTLRKELAVAELELRQGHKEQALATFEDLKQKTKEGMIFLAASQYAAFLNYELGKRKEAYDSLAPLKDRLDPEGLCLLHRLAFEENDYRLVMELAGPAFQLTPEAEVALRSAYAAANLVQAQSAIGWLQTAAQSGVENIQEIIQEKSFDPIRNDPAFQAFVKKTEEPL